MMSMGEYHVFVKKKSQRIRALGERGEKLIIAQMRGLLSQHREAKRLKRSQGGGDGDSDGDGEDVGHPEEVEETRKQVHWATVQRVDDATTHVRLYGNTDDVVQALEAMLAREVVQGVRCLAAEEHAYQLYVVMPPPLSTGAEWVEEEAMRVFEQLHRAGLDRRKHAFDGRACRVLMDGLERLRALEELDLCGCVLVDDEAMVALSERIKEVALPKLHTVRWADLRLSDDGFMRVLRVLAGVESVTRMAFTLTSARVKRMAEEGFRFQPHTRSLILTESVLFEDAIMPLIQLLSGTRVSFVNLDSVPMSTKARDKVAAVLRENSQKKE